MRRTVPVLLLLAMAVPLAGADDPDPPEFKGATVAPGPHGPGAQVALEVSWQDASGVVSASAYAQGPNNLAVHAWCDPIEPRRVVTVTCKLMLPEKAPAGEYRLLHVSAQDEVGHHAYHQVDIPFTVESRFTDVEGPRITQIVQHVMEVDLHEVQPGMTSVEGVFEIAAQDESNVTHASLQFTGPNGNRGLHVQCDLWVNGRSPCDLYADTEIPAGEYTLESASVIDEIGYHRYYARGAWNIDDLEDLLQGPASIQVLSPYVDDGRPVLTDLTFPGRLHRGQPFELRLNATDASPVESVQVWFQTTRGNAGYYIWHLDHCSGEPAPQRQLVCTGRFPDNFPLGLAIVDWVFLEDHGRNMAWYRAAEWGGAEHVFSDGDRFDVGTILVPRPVEGVLESVDAVLNEVMPGDVATIVYTTRDVVDDVVMVLEDAADGSRIDVSCIETVLTALGHECTFDVPADEQGVLSLVQATATKTAGDETISQTSTYATGEIPLLAVTQQIPKRSELPRATGGGALNDVGLEWQAAFRAAAEAKAQQHGSSTATHGSEPTQHTQPGPPPDEPVYVNRTMPAPPVSLRPHGDLVLVQPVTDEEPGASEAQPSVDVPMAWAPLALAVALLRRR